MSRLPVRTIALSMLLSLGYYLSYLGVLRISNYFLSFVSRDSLPQSAVVAFLLQDASHLLVLTVAAVPVVAVLARFCTDRALAWALFVGTCTGLYVLVPVLLDSTYMLFGSPIDALMFIWGHIKIAAMPALLIWLFSRWTPSNQPLHRDDSGGLTAAVVAGERRR